jgi:hypothetical protein
MTPQAMPRAINDPARGAQAGGTSEHSWGLALVRLVRDRRIWRELVVRQSTVGVVVMCVFWMRELSWEPDESVASAPR